MKNTSTTNSNPYKICNKSEIFVVIVIMRDLHEIVGILVQKPAMRIRKRLTTTLSGHFQEET